jgi:hypothetical protein
MGWEGVLQLMTSLQDHSTNSLCMWQHEISDSRWEELAIQLQMSASTYGSGRKCQLTVTSRGKLESWKVGLVQ